MMDVPVRKHLSWTDYKVLACLHEGYGDKEIAARMGISPATAKLYAFRLREKIAAENHSRIEIAVWAERVLNGNLNAVYPLHSTKIREAQAHLGLA